MQDKTERARLKSIVLNAHGLWLHDGTVFTNTKLIALFSRSIRRIPGSDQFEIQVGPYSSNVTVEDTAWFITSVETNTSPWSVSVSDGTSEILDPSSLRFGQHNQLYCKIKRTADAFEQARFSRSAFQAIFPFFNANGQLEIGSQLILIPTSGHSSS